MFQNKVSSEDRSDAEPGWTRAAFEAAERAGAYVIALGGTDDYTGSGHLLAVEWKKAVDCEIYTALFKESPDVAMDFALDHAERGLIIDWGYCSSCDEFSDLDEENLAKAFDGLIEWLPIKDARTRFDELCSKDW